MMRRDWLKWAPALILFLLLGSFASSGFAGSVDGFAVLMEVDTYVTGHENLPIDFVHIEWMTERLTNLGWSEDNMFIRKDSDVTQESLIEAIDWLVAHADSDDLVVFMIAGHGSYITDELHWNTTFPQLWASVSTPRKLLIVDACHSGAITSVAAYGSVVPPLDRTAAVAVPGIALSSVAYDEYGWVGIPEENDPIVGSPFLYYLVPAFRDAAADLNEDGAVSVEEAYASAVPLTQAYYRDVVFGAHPENLAAFKQLQAVLDPNDFPHPDMIDGYAGDLILDLAWYQRGNSD